DAIEQVDRAIELYKETFGTKPTGFWPAEGAVDEESVGIYKERGINWIATDEAILFKSLEDENRSNLYKPYDFKGVSIGFRDHGLSDLIGFNYRFKSAEDASSHFMHMVEPIAQKEDDATVFIILDGENAWEFFENNAYDFFTALYKRFSDTPWCKTVTMDEVTKLKNRGKLEKLAPGSWIHGNFDTWAGHPEKNRAWELIYQTKRDYEHHLNAVTTEIKEKIIFHFLAAECSDWFWWYGDDHVTEFSLEFDKLFREHLIAIYTLLNIHPPADLFEPIISHKSSASFLRKPQTRISPQLNGQNNSFFDWLGSGIIDESKLYSTMDRVRGPIEIIYYGQDDKNVYLAFEGDIELLKKLDLQLQVIIEETGTTITLDMNKLSEEDGVTLIIGERIELAISKEHFKDYTTIHLRFEILNKHEIIQTMPGYGALAIDLQETYDSNWFV
ncbi:MAG TPA: glycoside hydrolase, partial [Epsilonproteobacteria bacterium]|nr:glycoside hydrolase [Campylobacterota bacterium]